MKGRKDGNGKIGELKRSKVLNTKGLCLTEKEITRII